MKPFRNPPSLCSESFLILKHALERACASIEGGGRLLTECMCTCKYVYVTLWLPLGGLQGRGCVQLHSIDPVFWEHSATPFIFLSNNCIAAPDAACVREREEGHVCCCCCSFWQGFFFLGLPRLCSDRGKEEPLRDRANWGKIIHYAFFPCNLHTRAVSAMLLLVVMSVDAFLSLCFHVAAKEHDDGCAI